MTDLILIAPTPHVFQEETIGVMPPLGLIYLYNELKKNGFSARIFDFSKPGHDHVQLKALIEQEKPLALGFSFGTEIRFDAFRAAAATRRDFPQLVHIAGGPHPSLADVDTLTHIPAFDLIVRGEGERTLVEVMGRLKAGRPWDDVPGTTIRKNGRVVRNEGAVRISDLDALDSPYTARGIMADYPYFTWRDGISHPTAVIFTGRGCPFNCTFCGTAQFWGRQSRFRSVDNIIAEMKFIIEEYGARYFYFLDDTFNINLRRLDELLRRIIDELPPIRWTSGIRIDNITYETLELMKRAGCFKVTYGIESADQGLVDELVQKQIDLKKIPRVEEWIRDLELERRCFFIVGLPGETKAQAMKTIRMAKEMGGDSTVSILRIYPGTGIERIARERGVLRDDFSWSRVDLSQTYLRSIIGSSPIYMETLSWFDISCFLFEWAHGGQRFFSYWRHIPGALRDLRTWRDIWRLFVLGLGFTVVQGRRLRRKLSARLNGSKGE